MKLRRRVNFVVGSVSMKTMQLILLSASLNALAMLCFMPVSAAHVDAMAQSSTLAAGDETYTKPGELVSVGTHR